MGLLFTPRNRERLLVGQLLSQKRPQSGRRGHWLVGGVEEGKGSMRGRRQSCADHISFFAATLHPAGACSEAQTGLLEEQCLLLPDSAHLPSICWDCHSSDPVTVFC